MKNKNNDDDNRCKSAPAVRSKNVMAKCRESSECDDGSEDECNVAPKTRQYCISGGKYPCSFEEDSEEAESLPMPKPSKCSSALSRKSLAYQKSEEDKDARIPKSGSRAKSKVSIKLEQCGDGLKSSGSKYSCSIQDSEEEDDCDSRSRLKQDSKCSLSSQQSTMQKECNKPRKSSMKKHCKLADNSNDFEENYVEDCKTSSKESISKQRGCDGIKNSATAYKENKGFWGTLCFKKPRAKPLCSDGSRPVSRACNVKETQTSSQDLKVAQKIYKAALKEEKKLNKLYGKDKKTPKNLRSCAEERAKAERGETVCGKPVSEREFQNALDKYRQKRKNMEKAITKELEKELRKADVEKKKREDLKKTLDC